MKVLAYIIEFISLLSIIVSPLIFGCIIGAIFYFSIENTWGVLLGFLFLVLGIIAGTIWGINIWRKKGATYFISKINASPDIDKIIRENKSLSDDEL